MIRPSLTPEQESLLRAVQSNQRTAEAVATLIATFAIDLRTELSDAPLDPASVHIASRIQGAVQTLEALHRLISEPPAP